MKLKSIWIWPLVLTTLVLGLYLLRNSIGMTNYQQFSFLSKSFLEGSVSFTESYDGWWHDAVLFNEKYYWPLGPFPAIVLMPFQLAANFSNEIFFQGYLQFFLVIGLFILIYKIAHKLEFHKLDSAYLALGFTAGSTFLGVAMWPNSWFFAQVITTILIFWSFYEYLTKKRYWVIGIIFGLVFATRFTAALGIAFFALTIVFSKKTWRAKLPKIFQLGISMLPFVVLIGIYNFARFGNFLEQGYSYQNVAGAFGYAEEYGLFNPQYIAPNLYYMLFNAPVPVFVEGTKILEAPFFKADPWGMGLIFTSPFLIISLLKTNWKKQINIAREATLLLLVTCVVIAIPVLLYYGIGWYQYGYRYALDFLPFLFLVLLYNNQEKTLSAPRKFLILCSSLLNMYLFSTIFIL